MKSALPLFVHQHSSNTPEGGFDMNFIKAAGVIFLLYLVGNYILTQPQEAGQAANNAATNVGEAAESGTTFVEALGGTAILVLVIGIGAYFLSKKMK